MQKKKEKKNNFVDVHTWKCHLTVLNKSVYIDQGSKKNMDFHQSIQIVQVNKIRSYATLTTNASVPKRVRVCIM